MGYYCVLIQMPERRLMHMDEDEVGTLFDRVGSPHKRHTSLPILKQYEQPCMAAQPPPPISLEKMWLALHHLLTGEFRPDATPLSRSILAGKSIGVDVGDGPARYLWAEEVREISAALSSLTSEDLRRRYAPAELKAGWPKTPVRKDEDDERVFTGLEHSFRLLETYYGIAASRGNAMLIGVV